MSILEETVRLQVLVERYKASEARFMVRMLGQIDAVIKEAMARVEFRDLPPPELARLFAMLDRRFSDNSTATLFQYTDRLQKFAKEVTIFDAKFFELPAPITDAEIWNAAFESPLGIDGVERGQTIHSFMQRWWRNLRTSIFGAVRRGAYEKRSNSQLKNDLIGTKSLNYRDGYYEAQRRNITVVNGTLIQHVYGTVREASATKAGVKHAMWSSMLERTVCAKCRSLDGQIFELGKGPRSPAHYGCRCSLIFIRSESDLIGTGDSYYTWLKKQPRSFIELAIGKDRAALLLNGGINAERFAALQLDKKYDPLPLEELRIIAPSMFARAGV